MRTAESKSAAKTRLAQLEVEILKRGTARLEVTFRQIAEYALKRFYQPATYDETGRKVSGVRSVVPARSAINNLVAYFGDTDIRKIDDEALEKFKTHRLKTVSIATVDRELSKARKMFGVALSKKWIFDNPFKSEAGKQLIQVALKKVLWNTYCPMPKIGGCSRPFRKQTAVTQFRCSLQRWKLALGSLTFFACSKAFSF
jgi:hypothetical protein